MINLINKIKTIINNYKIKNCKHSFEIDNTYAIKNKVKYNNNTVTRYDVYEEYKCSKCGKIIKTITDVNCSKHKVVRFYKLLE